MAPLEDEVWQKGHVIQNADPNVWRTDDCGALMNREQYATETEFGWQIDHPNPQTGQETEYGSDLRPLQWLNSHSRKRGPLTCPVSWEDSHNSVTCKNCSTRWYPTTTTCPNCGTAV